MGQLFLTVFYLILSSLHEWRATAFAACGQQQGPIDLGRLRRGPCRLSLTLVGFPRYPEKMGGTILFVVFSCLFSAPGRRRETGRGAGERGAGELGLLVQAPRSLFIPLGAAGWPEGPAQCWPLGGTLGPVMAPGGEAGGAVGPEPSGAQTGPPGRAPQACRGLIPHPQLAPGICAQAWSPRSTA